MSRGRRVYLYSVALFGLVASLVSLVSFLWRFVGARAMDVLAASPLPGMLDSPALPWLVLFLVTLATWLYHIITANRAARPLTMTGAAERATPERKMYLYMGRLVVVAILAGQAWLLIRNVTLAFLDNGLAGLRAASGWSLGLAAGIAVALVYYVYLRVEASRDGDLGQERGKAVLWRRAYTYLAALVGALLTFFGGGELIRAGIRVLMTPLSRDVTWHAPAAAAVAALVVGLPLSAAAWGAANRAAAMNPPSETNALSRVLLRYVGVFAATLVTLVALGYLIEQIILQAISRPVGNMGHALFGLFDWTWALAYLPIAMLMWISFSSGARTDALWGGERARTASIRRVVRYTLIAASLAVFWYGLTEFTRLILQVFLGADAPTGSAAAWVQRFAASAAFLLVGAPAWWGHWWSQQIRVRTENDESGGAAVSERGSRARQVYLVGVLLVAAVVVVAAIGFAAVLALNWRSAGNLGGVRAAVAGAIAAALVAGFWALVHGWALRSDMRYLSRVRGVGPADAVAPAMAAPAAAASVGAAAVAAASMSPAAARPLDPAGESREYRREDLAPLAAAVGFSAGEMQAAPRALVVLDGGDGALGAQLVGALRTAFPAAELWPVGLNEVAHAAMLRALGPQTLVVPDDAFDRAVGLLAPSDVLIPGALDGQVTAELVDALARTPARIMLLPPRDVRLRWVAAPNWPPERWVENAVIEAGNLLGTQS